MNQTLRQQRAVAALTAEIRKQEERKRIERLNAARHRLIRRFITDRSGWLFAAACMGGAFVVVLFRVTT